MRDLDLRDPQAGDGRPDLHLQRPPPVPVVHPELDQPRERDRAKGREVLEVPPEELAHHPQHEPVAEAGVRKDRAHVSVRPPAHAEHQIGVSAEDRLGDERDLHRIVAAVGIDEDHDLGRIALLAQMTDPRETGRAVAALGLAHDLGASGRGQLRGAVRGAVVDDDDPAHERRNARQDRRERLLLVQRWHDDGHRPGRG